MKVAPQSVQRALNPLVSVLVDSHHDLLEQRRGRRYVQPPGKLDHAVHNRPGRPAGADADVLAKVDEGRVGLLCLAEAVDEVEARGQKL